LNLPTSNLPSSAQRESPAAAPGSTSLAHLRAVVMLAGTVRPTPLMTALGRDRLDLPIDEGLTLLGHWRHLVGDLADELDQPGLSCRVLIGREQKMPLSANDTPSGASYSSAGAPVRLTVEHDPQDYRGTGGVVRDATAAYREDDLVLVVTGPRIALAPLGAAVKQMSAAGGDVVLFANGDGSLAGLILARCAALRDIRAVGFVDLKEQALPELARHFAVRAVVGDRVQGVPLATREDYVQGLRRYHTARSGRAADESPWAEDWASAFALVEPSAEVASGVRLHDSVVLGGARVGRGALIVRSVIAPGALVPAGARLVDALIGVGGKAVNE
jgi:hypothetical protein